MNITEFKQAMEDMDQRMQGEGFEINVAMVNGYVHCNVVWSYLGENVIVLHDDNNEHPIYIAPEAIAYVRLVG